MFKNSINKKYINKKTRECAGSCWFRLIILVTEGRLVRDVCHKKNLNLLKGKLLHALEFKV